MEETWKDNKNWWNKVVNMTEDEIDTLPNEYIRKFGSFIFRVQEMKLNATQQVNKELDGMYDKVQNL